jgi:hypothetical protein
MNKNVGIWLDHKQAYIVSLMGEEEHVHKIESNADSHYRIKGGTRSKIAPGEISSERRIEERHKHQLHHYYQQIISEIKDAQKIYILGPGEARLELKKELQNSKELFGRISGIEAFDKMTENQIVARVKEYFK